MEKKKNTGLIITIIVLAILLFVSIIGNVVGFVLWNKRNNDYYKLYNTYTKLYHDYITNYGSKGKTKYKYTIPNTSNIKKYGENYILKVVGIDNQLYMIESDGSKSVSEDKNCENEIKEGATFNAQGKYSCTTSGITATKLYINETNVEKINVIHRIIANDTSTDVFIIFKDGTVKQTGTDAYLKDVFKNYKVKSVSEYCAVKNKAGNCTMAGYKLTLKDGTTKGVLSLT